MVEIEIDGKALEVEYGSTIIDAADKLGIAIPRFCYHKKLSVAANCRMCLVQVEKFAKPLPACATPVADGMKIFTRSKAAIEAQKSVMEFVTKAASAIYRILRWPMAPAAQDTPKKSGWCLTKI
jgi:NADH-quinone oxidoreductase subunit G